MNFIFACPDKANATEESPPKYDRHARRGRAGSMSGKTSLKPYYTELLARETAYWALQNEIFFRPNKHPLNALLNFIE